MSDQTDDEFLSIAIMKRGKKVYTPALLLLEKVYIYPFLPFADGPSFLELSASSSLSQSSRGGRRSITLADGLSILNVSRVALCRNHDEGKEGLHPCLTLADGRVPGQGTFL